MTTPPRRKRQLRPSFVVTFAAAAPLAAATAGCGAVVTPCSDGDGGASTCDARPPNPTGCPTAEPTAGGACTAPPTATCVYAYHELCPGLPSRAYSCSERTHTWIPTVSSCNPPPPTCPASAPANGAHCTPGFGRAPVCHYGDCNGSPTTEARCDYATQSWQVLTSSCNPPRPVCPSAHPTDGAPCPVGSVAPLTCNYEPFSECPGLYQYSASCDPSTGHWRVAFGTCNPPPPILCPRDLPDDDAPCTPDPRGAPLRCDYGTCSATGAAARATCEPTTHRWRVVTLACEDGGPPDAEPPTDADPPDATPPDDGGGDDAGEDVPMVVDAGVGSSDV